MKFTSTCGRCHKHFDKDTKGKPYRSQAKANQALQMHKGRVHDKSIPSWAGGPRPRRTLVAAGNNAFSGLDVTPGNTVESFDPMKRQGRKGKLSREQQAAVIHFIQAHRDDFPTKAACFTAALQAAGVANLIRNNSVAVSRYFAKASGERKKRKYTRRNTITALAVLDTPAQLVVSHRHGNLVKQCPRCGAGIEASLGH